MFHESPFFDGGENVITRNIRREKLIESCSINESGILLINPIGKLLWVITYFMYDCDQIRIHRLMSKKRSAANNRYNSDLVPPLIYRYRR